MEKVLYEANQNNGILLNANESPYNITEEILQEIKDALPSIAFQRYPNDDATQLRKAYAAYLGVDPDQVLAGNGSDEMIGLLIGLAISKGDKVYTLDPDFSMYDYYAGMHDGEMVTYHYELNDPFNVEDFIEYGRAHGVKLILFSNPNNPTGRIIAQKDLLKIVEAFPRNLVIIDEAYGEFAEASMLEFLESYQNLVVLRTMSKAFGAASLRCGFLVASTSTLAKIRPYKVPYNVNSLTQCVATILLQHAEEMKERIRELITSRDDFYATVCEKQYKDITLYPSQANYLYGTSSKKLKFLSALAKHEIAIRDYKGSDNFRITIGSPEENALVLSIMDEVFQERKG